MIRGQVGRISSEHRMVAIACGLAVIVALVFFQFGRETRQTIVTKTRPVKVSIAEQYGKPTQSVAGAQINQNLSGLTCDVYQAKATIICHRP